jgi:hypothetical protein
LGRAGWRLGLAFGLVHALFAGTHAGQHPAARRTPSNGRAGQRSGLVAAPRGSGIHGCFNYGQTTPLLMVIGHLAYGAIVGAFAQGAMR